jgi:F like protein
MATRGRTANEAVRDAVTSHAVDLQQYANGAVRRMLRVLNAADDALVSALRAASERAATAFTVRRLRAALAAARAVNAAAYRRLAEAQSGELRRLAGVEAAFHEGALRGALPEEASGLLRSVSAARAWAASEAKPLRGRLMSEWAESLPARRMRRLQDHLASGFVQGKTSEELAREIRGTRAQRYRDGLLEVDRREAASLARTATMHVAAEARDQVLLANRDLVREEVWASTLDTRTTDLCMARDGKRYAFPGHEPLGHRLPWLEGPGRVHWGCRSCSYPVIGLWRDIGLELPPAKRASVDGEVPADLSFGEWLAAQPAARQDEVLGPTRGLLYRKGKVSFDRFFNDEGLMLTLDELAARNARLG